MGGGNLPPRLSMTGSPQLSPRPPPEMPPIDNVNISSYKK